jgi:2,4-dienoyl-CoA reductase-like NADH-dependent reductase (Old Yellow Enzyme family)
MTVEDIHRVQADFRRCSQRARLLQALNGWSCTSPTAIWRRAFSAPTATSATIYGGSAENRARFLLEILAAVRKVWPEHLPLTARFGVVEYNSRDGQALVDSIEIGKEMRELA